MAFRFLPCFYTKNKEKIKGESFFYEKMYNSFFLFLKGGSTMYKTFITYLFYFCKFTNKN
ncbi:hypothetical protein A2J07_00340 [Fusobacterium necrophorum subsp. funduliforme]|uniref:Uncharacterized protein n=1 Tax=Fusobacterium necrophorum subsp. funduliforme TaxID=143387 RepID=A0A162J6D5_9FUSO|nr:hypothetical protein A2J07_00340 [Fusobacterium necrophorum subsp. funduliforme]